MKPRFSVRVKRYNPALSTVTPKGREPLTAFRAPAELLDALRDAAKSDGATVSAFIRQAVENAIQSREETRVS